MKNMRGVEPCVNELESGFEDVLELSQFVFLQAPDKVVVCGKQRGRAGGLSENRREDVYVRERAGLEFSGAGVEAHVLFEGDICLG